MISKTSLKFDLQELKSASDYIIQQDSGFTQKSKQNHSYSICLTSRPGSKDPLNEASLPFSQDSERKYWRDEDFCELNNIIKGTYLEHLIESLNFDYCRARLIFLPPLCCLPIHRDRYLRYHLAIRTNPFCFFSFAQNKNFQIPPDGYLYKFDARELHTAVNASKQTRLHLVICEKDPKNHKIDLQPQIYESFKKDASQD